MSAPDKSNAPASMTAAGRATAGEQTTRPRWFWPALLGICLVGAILRFLLRAEYLADNPVALLPRVDALTYWNWADRIAAGQLSDGVPFFSAPLYPYLLGLLRAGGGDLPTVYTIQIVLDVVTAGLLAWIARLRYGAPVGLLAAAVFFLMIEPASFCLRVLTSTLQLPLICLAWLALLATQRRPSLLRGIAAGAAIGLLALAYPPALLFLPIFAIWGWWNDGHKLTRVWRSVLCVAAGCAVISPATIHNYAVSGELFPIQSVLGINFRQGNGPDADGTYTLVPGLSTDREGLFRSAQRDFRRKHGRDGSWKEIDRYYRDEGLAYWREDPIRAVKLFARKAYWFLTGRNYSEIYDPELERDEGLMPRLNLAPLRTAWLIPPALLAIIVWLRRFNHHVPELMLFGVPLLVVVIFWYSPRYRLPAIPVIVVASAWVFWQAWQKRHRRTWLPAVGLALLVAIGLEFVNRAVGFDQLEPTRAAFRTATGYAFLQAGKLEQAADWYRAALVKDPELASVHGDLGDVLARLGETDEAFYHLNLAVKIQPDNPTFHDQLGRALVQQQKPDEAIRQFKIAVGLNPNDARLRNNLGNALLLRNELATAVEQYMAALRLEPDYADAHFNLGRALAAQGEAARALEHLAEAARLRPDLVQPHIVSAGILVSQGRTSEGIAALRKAHELAPHDDGVANDLAWYLATTVGLPKSDRTAAVKLAEQAVAQTPERSPNRLDTLAAALAADGQFERAVETMEAALESAKRQGDAEQIEALRLRLELYMARQPYIERLAPPAPATSQPGP